MAQSDLFDPSDDSGGFAKFAIISNAARVLTSDNYHIDEIRKTRDRIAKEYDYDPQKVLEHAQNAARDLGFVKV